MFGKTKMQFLVVVSMFFMASCDTIYEDLPRCELWLEFTFDYNMEYADAFDPQVNSVDVFVFGDDDKLLFTKRAEPTALVGGNRMSLADELSFGSYKILTVGSLSDLKNIEFTIAQLLNNSKEEITLMPMTGIKQGIYVKPGEAVNPVSMTVERAVSRVDVYLQVTDGGAQTGYINGSTTVTMHNLSHESVLVNGFGNMKANALLLDKTWTAGSSDTWIYSSAVGAKNRRLLCSFYTSERAFAGSNKPTISMTNIRKGAQPTDVIGVIRQELGQITPTGGGQSQDFEGFQRNNVYQITAKVGKLGIQIVRVSVEPWGDPKNIDVEVEL